MKKDVIITIRGIQTVGNESDEVELFTTGRFYKKENQYYLAYEETEATGFEGSRTTLKISPNQKVTMTRFGRSRSQLIVEKGVRHQCSYDTEYGFLTLGIMGDHFEFVLTEDGGHLEFGYSLDLQASLASHNTVIVDIKEAPRERENHSKEETEGKERLLKNMEHPNFVKSAMDEVESVIKGAFAKAMEQGQLPQAEIPSFTVEIPAETAHGDFATNAAMVSARTFRNAPIKIANILVENFDFSTSAYLEKAEIAGPGFINFFVKPLWFADTVAGVLQAGEDYGKSNYGNGEKVMIEFVSANPTGPMHMGNARGGAIGDGLASAMAACGYDVTREFYINDAGNQIEKFGASLEARYLQIFKGEDAVEFPEDGYHGEDIKERAQEYADIHGDSLLEVSPEERRKALVGYALPKNVAKLKEDLEKYRIVYDVWFPESSLHESGAVKAIVDELAGRGLTYEKDGAVWYKATQFGSEKDEVLIRANGNPTYFTADIAYHKNKFADRGFSRVINVWGADHHGHVARLKGAMDAIGQDGSRLDIVLMQLVRLMKDGEPYRMSKRTGKSVTLSDLTDLVPIDAARFFFNMREPNSTLDFDLDLAVEESAQNPVYYVQYAHARICSILKNLQAQGIQPRNCTAEELTLLSTSEEHELIRKLAQLPQEIINAAKNYDPARLTHYCIDTATLFHKFYNACRVQGEEEALMQARLNLCMAVKTVICNVLALLKITAPTSM